MNNKLIFFCLIVIFIFSFIAVHQNIRIAALENEQSLFNDAIDWKKEYILKNLQFKKITYTGTTYTIYSEGKPKKEYVQHKLYWAGLPLEVKIDNIQPIVKNDKEKWFTIYSHLLKDKQSTRERAHCVEVEGWDCISEDSALTLLKLKYFGDNK